MAMRRRAAAPKGGRPMRRIAPSCPEDTSGISEKSIPCRRVSLALLPARTPRADDADAFAIASPPHCIGHDEHAAGCRTAESQGSSLPLGMTQIRTIEGIRIAEHGRCLFERDPVLGAVDRRLPSVPLEHDSVYTKVGRLVVPLRTDKVSTESG